MVWSLKVKIIITIIINLTKFIDLSKHASKQSNYIYDYSLLQWMYINKISLRIY